MHVANLAREKVQPIKSCTCRCYKRTVLGQQLLRSRKISGQERSMLQDQGNTHCFPVLRRSMIKEVLVMLGTGNKEESPAHREELMCQVFKLRLTQEDI